jgi:hypothetical protein
VKIQVTGENLADTIDVVGGVPSRVIEAHVGTVFSVMGRTGAVTGLADDEDVAAAQEAAAADATAKVAAHVAAPDPHGDRAYADSLVAVGVTDWINVKKAPYNAKGDGTTDDTAEIQAALDAAGTGGTVYLPAGTYRLTGQLVVGSGITLLGAGPTASVLQQTSTSAHALYGQDLRHVTVANLGLTGPGSGTGSGIYFEPVGVVALNYLSFRDLFVKDFGGDGLHIVRTIVSLFERVVAQTNGGYGINLLAPGDAVAGGTSCTLNSCYGNGNTTGGIRLHRMSYSSLNACAADSSPVGYQIDLSYGVTLSGSGAEDCATGIKINGGQNNLISGGFIYGSRGICVHITGGAVGCGVAHLVEVDPITASGAVTCIKTDAGTYTVVTAVTNVKAMNYAAGTVQILDNGSGAATFNGAATFSNGITVAGASAFGYSYFAGAIEGASHIVTDSGNVSINGVGKTLLIKEGVNAKMGTATLNGTTAVTVATTAVTATSRIQLTTQAPGGTVGSPYVFARTAGTSFQIKSTAAGDTSTVAWMIVEPA